RRGIAYLIDRQREDGTWDEPEFTGCGFPGYGVGDQPKSYRASDDPAWQGFELSAGFMINYHLYRNYFPLWALGRYLRRGEAKRNADASERVEVPNRKKWDDEQENMELHRVWR